MPWSGEHHAFVVEEFIANGGSLIATQCALRIRFALSWWDPVLDKRTIHYWVSNFRQTSSALKKNSPADLGQQQDRTMLSLWELQLSDLHDDLYGNMRLLCSYLSTVLEECFTGISKYTPTKWWLHKNWVTEILKLLWLCVKTSFGTFLALLFCSLVMRHTSTFQAQ